MQTPAFTEDLRVKKIEVFKVFFLLLCKVDIPAINTLLHLLFSKK